MSRSSAATGQKLTEAAPVFAALGDPTRLRIVAQLCDAGPLPIVRLTHGANISRQAVTKHLFALSQAGLVRNERSGRENLWRFEPRRLADAQRYLDQISARWDEALGRLKALVERENGPHVASIRAATRASAGSRTRASAQAMKRRIS